MRVVLWVFNKQGKRVAEFEGEWSGSPDLFKGVFNNPEIGHCSLWAKSRNSDWRLFHLYDDLTWHRMD